MSDFDKEAEREKLRKKFADDEEKRADTQRMSELLLKGATMTNKHCDRCGDPLFRYNGQTFCSTCQAEWAGGPADAESAADDTQPAGDTEGQAPRTAEPPVDRSAAGREGSPEPRSEPTGDPRTEPTRDTQTEPAGDTRTEPADAVRSGPVGDPQAERVEPRSQPTQPIGGERRGSAGGRETAAAGSLGEARASLRRTVTRFARAAEETDEPRRARELLAAAREAAETLAALE